MRIILTGFVLLFIIRFGYKQTEDKGNLTIIVTGMESNNGDVLIFLADSKESYEGKNSNSVGLQSGIKDSTATFVIEIWLMENTQ